ncbi:MAG: D-aminoacyl-tRNA deacylase [Akkermansiaceae bacterium]|jgi:D-tyrosyl-tRNA(Tyr) deacylase|tara:strand:- start:519 stop:971 length:453 start_codon:yes stop_codon:yes gene_type:complete
MRVVLQRVSEASVSVNQEQVSKIDAGFLVLLGIEERDTAEDVAWLVGKITKMRVFSDSDGKMNQSLAEQDGDALVVSQFTLHASTKKGNRPSFIKAARTDQAIPLYEAFCEQMSEEIGKKVGRGIFGADMKIALVNDGPVTITLDSKNRE